MRLIILFIFITTVIYAQLPTTNKLLPQPLKVKRDVSEKSFKLTQKTMIRVESNSKELKEYTKRFIYRIQYKSGVFFETTLLQDTITINEILIKTNSKVDSLNLNQDESYKIIVESNKVIVTARTNIGAYRGLETLLQLTSKNKNGGSIINCTIEDNPRFKWRGLLIDVCRHWVPVHIIKRNIDAMAAVKMNVLHLHLTEDQGFRIESKKFPKLHLLGNNGNYFTQLEIKDIIQYAKGRGIRVIPEFDIPGHISSWLVGYPKLGSADREYEVAKRYGVFKASLNPIEEKTYQFLDTLLTEMCQLFPDAYFHIGGDENNGIDWDINKKIQKFMVKNDLKDNHALQAYFNNRILKIITRNGKKMVGWDEIYTEGIPNSIVIQSWRGRKSMVKSAQNGYPSLLSKGYYLDKSQTLKHYYETDPIPENTILTLEEQKMILGGEATMWTEIVDQTTIESRIWPSTLAVAERLWSSQANCDTEKFYDKVQSVSKQLQEFGLIHLSYQNVLLDNMTNYSYTYDFKPFISVLEPVRGYQRHNFMRNTTKYSTFAPLNRLADACYVESFEARLFNNLVKSSCITGGFCEKKEFIKASLAKWVNAAEIFGKMSFNSVAMSEAEKLALKVQELCELAWRKVNSPSELTDKEEQRAQNLIKEIGIFKLDVKFAPIAGIKIIFE